MSSNQPGVHRGEILHFLDDPARVGETASYHYLEDGLLWIENGRIEALGPAASLLPQLPVDIPLIHHEGGLLLPGFIDCHVHYPQMEMVAAYGEQLLEWLQTYTFPTERKFADPGKARQVADLFLDELLRNGTTTALVLATVHPQSAEAYFNAANARRMRMICGKLLMDRNAPRDLSDTPESGYLQSRDLIERWHDTGRLGYAVTPRFAPTSSAAQLTGAGQLLREYPGVYLHTHLAENRDEVAWVEKLFTQCKGYLDVYAHFGLLGPRSIFAHCIQLSDAEFHRLAQSGAGIAFCPTSNLFLGSGLFNLAQAEAEGIQVGLATDIGAGTSFSLLRTIHEAYKIQQLRGHTLSPFKSFYLATLGGARTLDLADVIGNFEPGKEADFVVLDDEATPLMALRRANAHDLRDRLFALAMLGDDRAVKATYVLGEQVYRRD